MCVSEVAATVVRAWWFHIHTSVTLIGCTQFWYKYIHEWPQYIIVYCIWTKKQAALYKMYMYCTSIMLYLLTKVRRFYCIASKFCGAKLSLTTITDNFHVIDFMDPGSCMCYNYMCVTCTYPSMCASHSSCWVSVDGKLQFWGNGAWVPHLHKGLRCSHWWSMQELGNM